jgi:hypothetical protein
MVLHRPIETTQLTGHLRPRLLELVEEHRNFQILEFCFFQAEFLSDAHAPFREATVSELLMGWSAAFTEPTGRL